MSTPQLLSPHLRPSDSATLRNRCLRPTPQQVLGPYFLANSPQTSRLFPQSASGSRVNVSGQVMSPGCQPLAGATVHVWLADPQGAYDNQDAQGNPLNVPAAQQLYRGRMVSDAAGNYAFDCLRPGNYFDSGWSL